MNVEVALELLNRTFFGDASTSPNYTGCQYAYSVLTPEYAACIRFQLAYPKQVGDVWGATVHGRLLPIFNLLASFSPACGNQTGNTCFVYTVRVPPSFPIPFSLGRRPTKEPQLGRLCLAASSWQAMDCPLSALSWTNTGPLRFLFRSVSSNAFFVSALPDYTVATMPICGGPSLSFSSLFTCVQMRGGGERVQERYK